MLFLYSFLFIIISTILIILFLPFYITFQGPPFAIKIRFFGLRCYFSVTPLTLKVTFLKKRLLITLEKILATIIVKIYYKLKKPLAKKDNVNDNAQKTTIKNSQKVKSPKSSKKLLLYYKNFPSLLKITLKSFHIQKCNILLSFEQFNFIGAFFIIRQLLATKWQQNIDFSFYKETHYEVVCRAFLGKLAGGYLFWFLKITLLQWKHNTMNSVARNNKNESN